MLLIAPILLSACAETQLAIHTAKRLGPEASQRDEIGSYKVGNPYKIAGVWYRPAIDEQYDETGIASWYGPNFHGKRTANGAIFNQNAVTAAHRTLPLPSKVRVTNLENGRSISVLVNDRGPFARGRIIDLSRRSAQLLGFKTQGTARVRVRILPEESRQLASLAGADIQIAKDTGLTPVAAPMQVSTAALAPPKPAKQKSAQGFRLIKPAAAATPPAGDGAVVATIEVGAPALQTEPVRPSAIYVQAGAFSQYHNANRLKARLAALGPTEVTRANVDGRDFYRVRIGPLASVDEGDGVLAAVAASGHPSAKIVVETAP